MSQKKAVTFIIAIIGFLFPKTAFAHHGGASAAFGPGSPVETTAPYTLSKGGWLLYNRFATVPFRTFRKFRHNPAVSNQTGQDTGNITRFNFNTSMIGYGISDALTAYVLIPYAEKTMERWGTSRGFGDTEFMLQYGFKHGVRNGIRGWYAYDSKDSSSPNRHKEKKRSHESSLHHITETKFVLMGSITMPNGKLDAKDKEGNLFSMGMQAGWAAPSINIGGAVSRQLSDHVNLVADIQYRVFSQTNEGKTANEFRINTAAAYQVFENTGGLLSRIDLIQELNYLHLGQELDANRNSDEESGGDVLYISPAIRFSFPKVSVGIIAKFPWIHYLNNESEQQGAEGLEKYRIAGTVSYSF
ncbi:MAG: hypothetical protein ACE5GM_03340 [bacterium]